MKSIILVKAGFSKPPAFTDLVELATQPLCLNNDVLWDVDLSYSFDMQYADSTFNLDLNKYTDPIVLYYDLVKEDTQETIEMIKISPSAIINTQRFPDGEKWINTKENTFG